MKNNIAGKVVVILDAGSALGAAAAQYLSNEGAVVVLGASDVEQIGELARELDWNGGTSLAIGADAADSAQIEHLLAAAVDAFGRVDAIVNNAGFPPASIVPEAGPKVWERLIDLNIKGMRHGTASAVPYMQRQRLGQIINVPALSSDHGGNAAASATKRAAAALSEGLHMERSAFNIRTTIISSDRPEGLEAGYEPPLNSGETMARNPDLENGVGSFARALAFVINLPENLTVNEILFRPVPQRA